MQDQRFATEEIENENEYYRMVEPRPRSSTPREKPTDDLEIQDMGSEDQQQQRLSPGPGYNPCEALQNSLM